MDYQFRRDLAGSPEAQCSMGYEAMGIWLTEELGCNQNQLQTLLDKIDLLQASRLWEYELEGQDYHLQLTRQQAEVRAALLDSDMACDEMEDMDYYDHESSSHCGLVDFRNMLLSWQQFINQPVK